MPFATTDDGIRLYYETTGSGTPLIFVHEYAGDYRSWEPQVRHFGQRYLAITFNARGYPPSDVPGEVAAYSQDRAADDIATIDVAALPPLPWNVEARPPSGRVLTSMQVRPGDVQSADSAVHTIPIGRVDLSCGRITIWAGDVSPSGPPPFPSPGSPGDCAP